jgi:hypothetical protein
MAEEIAVSRFGHGPCTDSDTDESLDDEEEDDVVDAPPSIETNSTWLSSSGPGVGGKGAATFQVEAGIDDEALADFGALAVFANDSSALAGVFILTLIFSVPTFIVPGPLFALQQQLSML